MATSSSLATWHGEPAHPTHPQQEWLEETKAFISDLGEDLGSTAQQMRGETKTDLFHKHLNALAISYFALIVLMLAGSIPVLTYLVSY